MLTFYFNESYAYEEWLLFNKELLQTISLLSCCRTAYIGPNFDSILLIIALKKKRFNISNINSTLVSLFFIRKHCFK